MKVGHSFIIDVAFQRQSGGPRRKDPLDLLVIFSRRWNQSFRNVFWRFRNENFQTCTSLPRHVCLSVCLFIRMQQLKNCMRIFMKLYVSVWLNFLFTRSSFCWNRTTITDILHNQRAHFECNLLFIGTKIFGRKVVEKHRTHFLCVGFCVFCVTFTVFGMRLKISVRYKVVTQCVQP
jgi:hypothetical protein